MPKRSMPDYASVPIASGNLLTAPILSATPHIISVGKPRMTQSDKWKQRPSVLRYFSFCDDLRMSFGLLPMRKFLRASGIELTAYFMSSTSEAYQTPHTLKPDLDNLVKGAMDALLTQDQFVHKIQAAKFWGPENLLMITLYDVTYFEEDMQRA
jgi:hypothetical protein